VKLGGLIVLFLGVLIIISVMDILPVTFWFAVGIIFAAIFLYDGLKLFRRFRGQYLGSLIFATILIVRLFNIWGVSWGFWQLFLAMIGSYMIGYGIVSIFQKGVLSSRRTSESSRQELTLSRPLEAETYEVEIEADLTKVLLMSTSEDSEKGFDANLFFDKTCFSGDLNYDKNSGKGRVKARCKARSGVSSVLSKSRLNLELNNKPLVSVDARLDGSDTVMDFSNMNLDTATIKTDLSRLSVVPSKIRDSRIDISCDVASVNFRVPKTVGLIIVHEGDLNWRDFEGLVAHDRGYASDNLDEAITTCQVFIKSDMSKISVDWI